MIKVHLSQSYGFFSSHVWVWELDPNKAWAPENWCFWTVVLEKILESPWDHKEFKPVNPKGNQPWIFIGRTDAEAEAPILWPPDAKNWLNGKDPDAGKNWGQEEKGMTEDGMVGWHHQLNGHEFEQTQGSNEGQRSLACCSSWGRGVGHDWATEQQQSRTTTTTESYSGLTHSLLGLQLKTAVFFLPLYALNLKSR